MSTKSDSGEQRQLQRQQILTRILNSVKSCQIRYAGHRNELATEDEPVVAELCFSLEAALVYGFKSKGFSILHLDRDQSSSFWPYLKVFLAKSELDRYYLLKNVTSNVGRCRAWIRASLNEQTLEKSIRQILADQVNLGKFYEDWSFLKDTERNSMLPSLAAGVSTIIFAINIDRSDLNEGLADKMKSLNVEDERIVASFPSPSTAGATPTSGGKKKKKKASSQLVSFDGDDIVEEPMASSTSSPKPRRSLERQILVSQTTSKSRALMASASNDSDFDYNRLRVKIDSKDSSSHNESEEDDIDLYSRTSASDSKSVSSSLDDRDRHPRASGLTPMKESSVGALIPVQVNSDLDLQSEDSVSIRSFGEESDYASAACSVRDLKSEIGSRIEVAKTVSSVQNSTISREDLKQALLSVMQRKDELQEQCAGLKKLLKQESEKSGVLKEEVADAKRKHQESIEKLEAKITNLSRENELLKHQLKKYVGAVQKLRDGPAAHETLAELEKSNDQRTGRGKYRDYHYEASEYEKKLIQVAEMHGELLEFNEHLQRMVQTKDVIIFQLRQELVDLRGPLPNEAADDDTASVHSIETASTASGPSARALLNIWIPSVFLSGSGSKTHHVYQVYLRIKDEEWNIYRRYSDFFKLHCELKSQEPMVGTFDFPPKKTVGYKAEKVVEDRRKRLQSYLRSIVNLLVQTNPSLSAKPNKESVVMLLPFFGENTSSQRRHQQQTRSQSQGRTSLFSRRRSGATPAPPELNL